MALIGHWVAADAGASGTTLPDRSASAADGTLTGGCTWVTTCGEPAVRCPASDYVAVPDHARWTLGDFTLLFRGAFNSVTGQPGILSHSEGSGAVPKWVWDYGGVTGARAPGVHWQTAGKTVLGSTFVPHIARQRVYAMALRRVGNVFSFYLNRATNGGATETGAFSDAAATLKLGWGGEGFFDGNLDIVAMRIYDTALTDDAIYTAMDEDEAEAAATTTLAAFGAVKLRVEGPTAGGPTLPIQCDDALTDDDLISFRWDAGDTQLINRMVAEFDYDGATGAYTKMLIFSHDDSVRKYGPRPALHIQSQGLRTDLDADAFLEARAREVFRRFGDAPPAVIQIEAFYRKGIAWEAGDIICLTSDFIPNLQISGRGITDEPFELIDVRPQFGAEGKLVATLLDIEAVTDQPPLPVSIAVPTATFSPLTEPSLMGVGGSFQEG